MALSYDMNVSVIIRASFDILYKRRKSCCVLRAARVDASCSWPGSRSSFSLQNCGPGFCRHLEPPTLAQATPQHALSPLCPMSVVYSRRLKKELQEIQIEQADPAKRAAGASRHCFTPPPSRAPHGRNLSSSLGDRYPTTTS